MFKTIGALIKQSKILNPWLVIVIFLVSIYIGGVVTYTKADLTDIIGQRDSLIFKKERLSFEHDLNQIKKTNALYFDKYHIKINHYLDRRLDLLTIANHSRHPCETGKINGCWQKEIDVYKGDIVAVQLHYHNASPIIINDISFILSRQHLPHSIRIEVTVKVKNNVIAKDIVTAYYHSGNSLNILLGQGNMITTTTRFPDTIGKKIDELKFLVKKVPFTINKLQSNEQGSIIYRFKVINE